MKLKTKSIRFRENALSSDTWSLCGHEYSARRYEISHVDFRQARQDS